LLRVGSIHHRAFAGLQAVAARICTRCTAFGS